MENLTPDASPRPASRRPAIIIGAVILLVLLLLGSGLFFYGERYRDRVLPNTYLGDTDLGGYQRETVKQLLERRSSMLMTDGIRINAEHASGTFSFLLPPSIATEGASTDLVSIRIDAAVDALVNARKGKNLLSRGVSLLLAHVRSVHVYLPPAAVEVRDAEIQNLLHERLAPYEQPPRQTNISIAMLEPLSYTLTPAAAGAVYDYAAVIEKIKRAWQTLEGQPIAVALTTIQPEPMRVDASRIEGELSRIFAHGSVTLGYTNSTTAESFVWTIEKIDVAGWLELARTAGGQAEVALAREPAVNFLQKHVAPGLAIEAQNAKFQMEEGRAVEFQGSRPGRTVDEEKTLLDLSGRIRAWADGAGSDDVLMISVAQTEPEIKTSDANTLGITEVIGVGVSNFAGSPANRVKNIRHAVEKLNGILIKPDEVFSTITYTQPFTEEAGYLPELVIKGDEITPEVGGGLCQIGTTLFRMAMNSALPIVERRNHSLVVQYYGDLRNGLPGTDATIYEPAPDFRFKNDTGQYVLLETHMNTKTGDLIFTLWGTSDGRKGSYSEPVVDRWIPHGETRVIETAKLSPGEKKCQKAYRGAEASFTYTRELASGEKEEQVFESYYRPLPEICLVGAAAASSTPALAGDVLPLAIE